MADETSRLSAAEIYARVERGAEDEFERPWHNLGISAVAAGLAMGLSGRGVAVLLHALAPLAVRGAVAYLAYSLGFLIVILGRQQLFTENTLFPVALVLAQRRYLGRTAVLWSVVLGGNLLGTLLFAVLATTTPAVRPEVLAELASLGAEAASPGAATVFWSAVVGGWIIALVAWVVTAGTDTASQVLVIVRLTYLVGIGHFAHSIAGSGEVLTAVLAGQLSGGAYFLWLLPAVAGNVVGGVGMVALFNYGQVHED